MFWTVIGYCLAYLAGIAVHEATHDVTARALNARVIESWYLPPEPYVLYETPHQFHDKLIRASTIPGAVVVWLIVLSLLGGLQLVEQLTLIVFGVAYTPRSHSDWGPVVTSISRNASYLLHSDVNSD